MENKKYEGFSLALAVVDAIPVIVFGLNSILIGLILKSPLFIIGASICFTGGFLKVLWKFILALKNKDIPFLNKQMRYLMTIGFIIILVSIILNLRELSLTAVTSAIFEFPQFVFFILWLLGMLVMCLLAKHLDSKVAKNNWIEQCVNSFSQLCMFLALLFIYFR